MTVRKRSEWKLKSRSLPMGERTLIMGILNLTPDSFSDGGRYSTTDSAYARALELEEQGADIIDIGAESTQPGSSRITEDEEIRRLIPVLKRLEGKLSIPVSVDTYKAAIAQRALDLGVEIINDPSGLTFEPDLAKVVLNGDAGLILNHMRGTPETWAKLPPQPDVVGATLKDLEATVNRAIRSGIDKRRLVIDPGLGFGKRKEQNFELIAGLEAFAQLDLPILIGPSRKGFLARTNAEETAFANAAAVTAAVLNGAYVVRVHEVSEMAIAAGLADAVLAAVPPPAEPERERRPRDRDRPASAFDQADRYANRPLRPPQAKPAIVAAEPAPVPAPVEEPKEAQLDLIPEVAAPATEETQPAAEKTPVVEVPPKTERPRNQPLRAAASPRPREERPAAGDRPYRKPREDRDRPSTGGAPGDRPYRKPREDSGDRPYRPQRDRSDDRPGGVYRERDKDRERPSGPPWSRGAGSGDRPSGPPRPRRSEGDDRPSRKRSFSGDDRPSGPPRPRRTEGDDRPPRKRSFPGEDRPRRTDGDDRPPRKRSFSGDDRPSGPPWKRGGAGAGERSGPPRGGKPGGRPFGPPRGRSSEGEDRPSGPPRGGKGASGGKRPFGPPRGGKGGKGPGGGRPSGPPRGGKGGPPRKRG